MLLMTSLYGINRCAGNAGACAVARVIGAVKSAAEQEVNAGGAGSASVFSVLSKISGVLTLVSAVVLIGLLVFYGLKISRTEEPEDRFGQKKMRKMLCIVMIPVTVVFCAAFVVMTVFSLKDSDKARTEKTGMEDLGTELKGEKQSSEDGAAVKETDSAPQKTEESGSLPADYEEPEDGESQPGQVQDAGESEEDGGSLETEESNPEEKASMGDVSTEAAQ